MPEPLRFEWYGPKAAANRAKHKVTFEEAATVFRDPLGRIADDPRHSEGEERFVLLGQSDRRRLLVVCSPSVAKRFISSVRGKQRAVSEEGMKKANAKNARTHQARIDEILPEYDFSRSRPNKYASRYAKGSVVVTLDPDVAAVFPGAREANDALRALAGVIRSHKTRRPSRRSA